MRTQSRALGQQRGCGPLLPSAWRAKKLPRRGLLRLRAEYSNDPSTATAAEDPMRWNIKKFHKASDGANHLGSVLERVADRPFPGPPPDEGPPLRVLPIGGLGEIGMNCMLVGVKDRYILVDAGLMFPDFQDLGMQKILPDVSFLAQWRDKIEAVVITHGHEDHIGALPWVIPALDPSVPVYGGGFVLQLVARRLQEFNLYDPARFHVLDMRSPVTMGPFEVTPIRVTHSIPDCCGLIMRSEHGTIVHTGDWKIDEDPVDGEAFDREAFDLLHKEPIALMMSDSTNVLAPGRTTSERLVEEALVRRVMGHEGRGRVICTQFASNLHRMASVKKAADAAGRRIAFIGMSLNTYLEAAHREGRAPIDPKDLIPQEALPDADPNKVLIITTGSQAEPRAQLSLAARQASNNLKIIPNDLVLYSAKVIPGNEVKVAQMLNGLSMLGAQVAQGRSENLHTSGHAYQDELEEVLRFVKPQHFLPVHGEYAFLCEHARLARERAGVRFTEVIRNGQMLGVHERRNRNTLSTGSMAAATVARDRATGQTSLTANPSGIEVIGEVPLVNFYNDGGRGTGTAQEMALPERATLAFDGVVVAAVDVFRANPGGRAGGGGPPPPGSPLRCRVRITTRGMWLDKGRVLDAMHQAAQEAVSQLTVEASLTAVERAAVDAIRRAARALNNRRPEVIVVAYEHDPRLSHIPEVAARKAAAEAGGGREWQGFGGFRPSEAASKGLGPAAALRAGAEIGGLGGIRTRPPPGMRPGGRGGRGGRDGGRGRGGGGGGSGSDSEGGGGGASSRSSGGGGRGGTGPAGGAAGRGAAAAMAARLAAQAAGPTGAPKWGWGEVEPSSSQGQSGSAASEGTAAGASGDLGRTESAASASSTGSSSAAAGAEAPAPARRRRRSTAPPADAAAGDAGAAAEAAAAATAAPKKRGRKPRAAAAAELPLLKVMTPEDMAAMESVARNPRRDPKEGAAGDDLSYG